MQPEPVGPAQGPFFWPGPEEQAVPGPYPRHVGRHGTARYSRAGRLPAPRIYKRGLRSAASSRVTPNPKSYPRRRPLSLTHRHSPSRAIDLTLLHSLSLRPSLHSLPAQQRRPSPSLSRGPCSGAPRWSSRGPPRRSSCGPCSGALVRRWRDPALPCRQPVRSGLRRWRHGAGRLSSGADVSGQGRRGSSVGRRGSPPPWRIRSPRPPSPPSAADPVNSGGGAWIWARERRIRHRCSGSGERRRQMWDSGRLR